MKLNVAMFFLALMLTIALVMQGEQVKAQKSEIGVSFILSGHFIFGPYYRYWIDDHNALELNVQAAYENSLVFPGGVSAAYRYYFFDGNWRPSLAAQYTVLISPKVPEKENKRVFFPIASLNPGVQFRFNEKKMGVEEQLWIGAMKLKGKWKVAPLGLDTRFGYCW
ncbi:MAG: hypothetical protein IPH88_19655 [Bacteroidales bacterium]|nr:hypothetical protein [Bacteroidales bacterium]